MDDIQHIIKDVIGNMAQRQPETEQKIERVWQNVLKENELYHTRINGMKEGKLYILVDTAGIRQRRKFKETVEIFSLSRTKESIKRSDVVIVMIDASIGLQREDLAVLDYVIKEGRSCILLINKWDLIEKETNTIDKLKKETLVRAT